jgi:hypothetical protein
MKVNVPPVPLHARLHLVPKFFRFLGLLLVGFAVFSAAVPLLLPWIDPTKPGAANLLWLFLPFAIGMTVLGFYVFKTARGGVATADEGIWWIYPEEPSVFLAWREISEIRERSYLKCLVLSDSTRVRQIRVEYQVDDFNDLRELILSKATSRNSGLRQRVVFHQRTSFYLVFGGIGVLFLVVSIASIKGLHFGAAIPLFFACLSFGLLLVTPKSVRIHEDRFVVSSPLRKQTVYYKDIRNIDLRNVEFRNNPAPIVFVESSGKRTELGLMREGSIALYETLRDRWRQATIGRSS